MDEHDETASSNGTWAQVYGDYERHSNLAPGSIDNPTRTQKTFGQIAGLDTTYRRGNEALQLGILGGHSETRSRFTDTPNVMSARQEQDGGFIGAYGSYQLGRFAIDGLAKADFFQHSQRAVLRRTRQDIISCPPESDPTATVLLIDPGTPLTKEVPFNQLRNGQVPEHNYTVSSNAYYRYDLGGNSWFEPTAGIRFTYTDFGRDAFALDLQDGRVLRLQAGARIGSSWDVGSRYTFAASLLGLVYSDVWVDGFTLVDTGFVSTVSNVDEGKLRGLGQINLKLDNGRGVSYGAEVAVRGGEDVWGVGGRLGVRYEW